MKGGHVARMGEKRNAYRLLVGKPEGKRPLARPRLKWVDNIWRDVVEMGWGGCGLDWSGSGWGQVESSCECGIEPLGSIKCWETSSVLTTRDLSSSAQLHGVLL
jgi:hypothetical protein